MNNVVSFYIWYGLAVALLWLPPAALLSAVGSLAHPRLRPYAATGWLVSLGAAFCACWSIGPAMFAIPSKPDWVLLFHSTLGVFPAGILQAVSGIISGASAGWWLARRLAPSRVASPIWRTALLLLISVVTLFVCYIPPAGFEDWLAGGSGYGEGVPKVFMRFFEAIYLPVFRWNTATAKIPIGVPFTYAPIVFSVTGPLVVVIWIVRRVSRRARERSGA